ncbi:MAG: Glycosyl transferase group 1, partial [uncultured bacterium]
TFFFSSLRRSLDYSLSKKITEKHILKKYSFPPTFLEFLWNKLHFFPIDNFVGNNDLVITSDWTEPPAKTQKITIIHDLVYLKFPETLHKKIVAVQKRRLQWVKKESSLIIADSYNTKQDLIKILKIPKEKIEISYPPVSVDIQTKEKVNKTLKKYSLLNKPFILTVGKIEPRKNVGRLIAGFLKAKLDNIDLIIVGSKGWATDYYQSCLYRQTIVNNKRVKNIRFLGFIPDNDLYSLYQSALFFIFPSIYEGFGYPIIEAMKLDCPVATSFTSSLKEIASGSALLFNPYDEDEIAKTLFNLTQNQELRNILKSKGKIKSREFSAEKFAHSFLKIINKIYDNRN